MPLLCVGQKKEKTLGILEHVSSCRQFVMRAVDLRTPWGRSAEDVIARKRERYEHTLHRNRLAGIRSTIDCGEPATVDMRVDSSL